MGKVKDQVERRFKQVLDTTEHMVKNKVNPNSMDSICVATEYTLLSAIMFDSGMRMAHYPATDVYQIYRIERDAYCNFELKAVNLEEV